MALEDGGYTTRRAPDGEEAISILDERKNYIRALITDVNLGQGKFTGWDVAKHSRQINPALPVVYMTGANAHESAFATCGNAALPDLQNHAVTCLSSDLSHNHADWRLRLVTNLSCRCAEHLNELHRSGSESLWWKRREISPLVLANALWEEHTSRNVRSLQVPESVCSAP